MYGKVKRVSDRLAGESPGGGRLFLALNTVVWFICAGILAAVLCLLIGETAAWMKGVLFGLCMGIFPGFYGGILYLYRKEAGPVEVVRPCGAQIIPFRTKG